MSGTQSTTPADPPPPPLSYAGPAGAPGDAMDHFGKPLPPNLNFFAPPPPEIGQVVSAWSALKAGRRVLPRAALVMMVMAAGAVVGLVLFYLPPFAADRLRDPSGIAVASVAVAVVAAIAFAYFTTFQHVCSYVGTEGVARFMHRGNVNRLAAEVLLFPSVVALRTSQTRQYVNGAYAGTSYNYSWFDYQGGRALQLKGTHRDRKGIPKPNSKFNYALAAERAWSSHYLKRAAVQLEQQGFLHFDGQGGDFIRVSPGMLHFRRKGQEMQVTPAELKGVSMAGGTFTIQHKDATWYGKGKYAFPYGTLSNARVFLLVLEKLVGYRFG